MAIQRAVRLCFRQIFLSICLSFATGLSELNDLFDRALAKYFDIFNLT